MFMHKEKLIKEKTVLIGGNEEEVFKMKLDIEFHTKNNNELLRQIIDGDNVNDKHLKLKDIESQLKEKHRAHT